MTPEMGEAHFSSMFVFEANLGTRGAPVNGKIFALSQI